MKVVLVGTAGDHWKPVVTVFCKFTTPSVVGADFSKSSVSVTNCHRNSWIMEIEAHEVGVVWAEFVTTLIHFLPTSKL